MSDVLVTTPVPQPAVSSAEKPIIVSDPAVATSQVPKPEPKSELQSHRFAALAKKESALVRERAALKVDREKVFQEKAEASKLLEAQKLASTDPLKALELLGITYRQLTEYVLNDNKPTPDLQARSLEEKLREEFKKELQDRDKKSEDAEKKRQEDQQNRALEEFKSRAGTFLQSNKDKYPLINHPKNNLEYTVETITAMIAQHYDATTEKDESGNMVKAGQLMNVGDAAKAYEEHLADLAKDFYSQLQPKSDGQLVKPSDPKSNVKSEEPRTLTNQMSSSMTSVLPAKTEADRIKRALAALG